MFVPYACGFVTPKKECKLYYLTDYNNPTDMLKQCIIDMTKYDLGCVYVHNLSRFDV